MNTLDIMDGIAVVGMSCRFPGAGNIDEFWKNLKEGIESITYFSDEELADAGVDPAVMNGPDYVRAGFVMKDADLFDAHFFGYSPREAEIMDPQQRLFLETAYEALEHGGYSVEQYNGSIGVFGGSKMSTYLLNMLRPGALLGSVSDFQSLIGNDKDYLTTRVSYKLNLKGPSVCVQSACSTSLVAVHLACESLLSSACDMALAGGAAIIVPQKSGYPYQEGMVLSPDGHCRAFDSNARGMAPGNGVGMVLLKRLENAIDDRDTIHAVIRGSAINNDGSLKMGYTTPSVEGQAHVIREALAISEVEAESLTYIETHGTGTALGDPVEIAALTKVFSAKTEKKQFCAIGSVKTNIGHLDTAAGVASLIKAILCLKHGQIPPSLNYETPNPKINFPETPFFVNTALKKWKSNGYPRRAGVSSFGFGGTNAHMILEEPPSVTSRTGDDVENYHLVTMSAKTENALDNLVLKYRGFLSENPDLSIGDIGYTTNTGRARQQHRLAFVANSTRDLVRQMAQGIETGGSREITPGSFRKDGVPEIGFLFTGQGSQYNGMGQKLYDTQPVFRKTMERCDNILQQYLEHSILSVIFNREDALLHETAYTQPALFALEYSLFEMWCSWGIGPTAVMGHSVGEYVAACAAGVFSLEDGLKLIAARGRLIQGLPAGGEMYAVFAGEEAVREAVSSYGNDVSIAAINGPENIVISGTGGAMKEIIALLDAHGFSMHQLRVSHAFHSPMMASIMDRFEQEASEINYSPPKIELISNITGRPVKDREVCRPAYWRRHLREPVQFYSGIKSLNGQGSKLLLELGPDPVLVNMGKRCVSAESSEWITSLRKGRDDLCQVLTALGACYAGGADINWDGLYHGSSYQRISLPTYPFEHKRFWMTPQPVSHGLKSLAPALSHTSRGEAYPFNGQRLCSPSPIFEFAMTMDALPSLKDHRIYGMTVLPAGAYWEMLLAAGRNFFESDEVFLTNLTMHEPMILNADNTFLPVQIVLNPESPDKAIFNIYSLGDSSEKSEPEWKLHMSGNMARESGDNGMEAAKNKAFTESESWSVRGGYTEMPVSDFCAALVENGIVQQAESPWWHFRELRINGKEVFGKIAFTRALMAEARNYQIHPSIIDPCIQTLTASFFNDGSDVFMEKVFLPIGFDHVRYFGPAPREIWCHASIRPGKQPVEKGFVADFRLFDDDGGVIADIIGVHMRGVGHAAMMKRAGGKIFYELQWHREKVFAGEKEEYNNAAASSKGRWVVFAGHNELSKNVLKLLENRGEETIPIFQAQDLGALTKETGSNALDREALMKILGDKGISADRPCRGIIYLWGLDTPLSEGSPSQEMPDKSLLEYAGVVHLIQAINGVDSTVPLLCLVTRGGQAVGAIDGPLDPGGAPIWGLKKVLAREHPEINCMALDLDPSGSGGEDETKLIWEEVTTNIHEREVALRNGERYVPRLMRASLSEKGLAGKSLTFNPDGTYIVTGGLGGIGLEMTRWLLEHGARHIALIGRSQPATGVTEKIDALKQPGTQIIIARADVNDYQYLSQVIGKIRETMPPLRGVFHLAGVTETKEIDHLGADDIEKVMSSKVRGTWNMHLLTLEDPIDHFVLFSSISSLWGWHGTAAYSSANAFLDAVAHHRQSLGLPGVSIDWGAFSQVGMLAHDNEGALKREKTGIGSFAPQEALAHLALTLQLKKDLAQICIAKIDWEKFFRQPDARDSAFLSAMAEESGLQNAKKPSAEDDFFLKQLRSVSGDKRREHVAHYLQKEIAELLHMEADALSFHADLIQMGMDSLMFLGLVQTLNKELKIKIVPHTIFEDPTINALAERFSRDIAAVENHFETNHDASDEFVIVPDHENRFEPFELRDIQQAYWVGRSGIMGMGRVSCHAYQEFDTEDLDIDRYETAWQCLIQRHEMLRMIVLPDGHQRILEHVPPYRVKQIDLRGKSDDEKSAVLDDIRREMSHQVLPTDQWPLFDIRASRLDEGRIRLHFSLDLLIADVHSINLMMRELKEFYANPHTLDLPPLEISFRDYTLAEEVFRTSDSYRKSRDYWLTRQSTLPMGPELPVRKQISDLKTPRFVRKTAELRPDLWLKLKKRAGESGLTPSGILLAAYAEILSFWSKSTHFTINVPIFNRFPVHPQVNDIVGDFTSILFQEVHIEKESSFVSRAINIQKQFWKDVEYRFFSGVRFHRELARNEERWHLEIMPVVFTSNLAYDTAQQDNRNYGTLGKVVYGISQTPQIWLDLMVSEENGALVVFWDVVEEIFPRGLLDDMFQAYIGFLRHLAEEDEIWREPAPQLIPDAQLLKRKQVNDTGTENPVAMLHELFVAQALKNPERIAVVTPDTTLSYKELLLRAAEVGSLLRAEGAGPNQLVAVVMEKGWEQVAAVLGILLSGGAYLPIASDVPEKRRHHLLTHGEVNLVLTQSRLEERFTWPEKVRCFSVDMMAPAAGEPQIPESLQQPDDLAYVIYTSGSTGLPKGVMIDHIGAVNTIMDINTRFNIKAGDKIFALSALNFDLSVYDIFGALAAGATLVMPAPSGLKDPAHWMEMLSREKVSIWNSVPMLMKMLVEYAGAKSMGVPDSLRLALLSGDWIPLDLPESAGALMKNLRLVSLGGATEASIWSIFYPITEVRSEWNSIPYGRPMMNQTFYVLNENLEICPDWATGHLYIGGIGLAKGYWRDEKRTSGSFITHPGTGERLYRTGDLGRYLPGGDIEFLGREDFQVKISGYRIELGEVESVLRQCEGVKEVVVNPAGKHMDEKHLVGYLVLEKGKELPDEEVKDFLKKQLPDYMTPKVFIYMDTLPLSNNGKVNRKALPEPEPGEFSEEKEYILPETEMEGKISSIVENVLQMKTISIHDKFFTLGANSLDMVKLKNRIDKIFEQDISIVSIFEHSSIYELSRYMDARMEPSVVSIARTGNRATTRKNAAGRRRKRRTTAVTTAATSELN